MSRGGGWTLSRVRWKVTITGGHYGGRSPLIGNGDPEFATWPSGQVSLPNATGIALRGCSDVTIQGAAGNYNTANGLVIAGNRGVTRTATVTSGSSTLTVAAGGVWKAGEPIGGPGIPAGTFVGVYNSGAATITLVDSAGAAVLATASAAGVTLSRPCVNVTVFGGEFLYTVAGQTANVYVEKVGDTATSCDQSGITVYTKEDPSDGVLTYMSTSLPTTKYEAINGVSGSRVFLTNYSANGRRWEYSGGSVSGVIPLRANQDGQLATESGRVHKRVAKTANYTITMQDEIVGVTDTSSARTITLPSAATVRSGALYTIKDESGAAVTNNITIARAGSDTIDGATSKVINTNYGVVTLYSDGTSKWFVR
jgi:hypothetical protein